MSDLPLVLFDADLCRALRVSHTTLKRLRRHGALQIPELPALDKRHRYARGDVERFLARETRPAMRLARRTA
jgi:predicted site-specific integrase-resolvase